MENNLNDAQQRAVQYWFIDGLAELSGGAIGLLLAVYFIVLQVFPALQASFALIYILLFIAVLGIRKLMLWFRTRSTYGRTGYIEPKHGWENRWLLWIAIGFTLLLLGFMLYTILLGIQSIVLMPILGAIIFAFIFFLAGFRTKLVRFIYLAIVCLILGIVLSTSGLGDNFGAALLSLIISLILFTFGSITRTIYLRQAREIEDQTSER